MFIKGSSGASHPHLHTYQEGYLLPVLTGDELLFTHRHKGLLRQLRDLSEVSTDDFDDSYALPLVNFMEFIQVLPHEPNGILGSLLNYTLARTVSVFQKYCQYRKGQTTPLLKFAVFSAALLKDVGRVVTNQRIVLVDEKGDFQRDWNPLSGSMVGQSHFYKVYQLAAHYLRIETEVTPLLARSLIPHEIFLWLSSDLAVFSDWLAALLSQEGVGSKEITLALSLAKLDDILAVFNSMDGASVDMHESVATEYGEAFYRWLKDAIEKNDIAVNTDEASLHVLPEGVLIEKKLFKQFADLAKLPVNFVVVFQQFGNLMGIAKKGGSDFMHAQYFSANESPNVGYGTFAGGMSQRTRSAHEGIIVNKDAIFIKKDIAELSSLKSAQKLIATHHQHPTKTGSIILSPEVSSQK